MTLTIKTTLKDLLNSRFIIIYRFSPSLHKKRAVLPAKSSKPYSPKSSLLAFWLVTSITSCVSSPLICASFSATYFILRLSFLLPRLGSGAIYGLSVSRTILSIGIYAAASTSFLAFLNVRTPPIPIEKPMLRKSLAASLLYE